MPDDGAAPAAPKPHPDPLWEDWDEPPRVPDTPVLHLDGFDGPMDLLLDLAERQRIDLGRISVLALAEQFVAAMERVAERIPLERQAEWLVLAARLVLLRSRLLFPASPEAAEQAEHDAAREAVRLDTMRLIRAAAAWLQARPQLGHDVFAQPRRGPEPRVASYMALMEACLAVLREGEDRPAAAPVHRVAIPDLFRVPDALVRMRAQLAALTQPEPMEAFLPALPNAAEDRELLARSAVSSTFLASLELARAGEAELDQIEPFGTLMLTAVPPREMLA